MKRILKRLMDQHRHLDQRIDAENRRPRARGSEALTKLKRLRLLIKDRIAAFNQSVPDRR